MPSSSGASPASRAPGTSNVSLCQVTTQFVNAVSMTASDDQILECGPLRVVFTRSRDRIAHRVLAVGPDKSPVLLESIEGSDEEDWPPSPAFREVHLERRADDQQVAFLVGMAGSSHWSASIAADAASGRLSFDVACRLREVPRQLGSCYTAVPSSSFDARRITLQDNAASYALDLGDAVSNPANLLDDEQRVQIAVAALPASQKFPVTLRWQYAIQVL
jgi:hypothetical protein